VLNGHFGLLKYLLTAADMDKIYKACVVDQQSESSDETLLNVVFTLSKVHETIVSHTFSEEELAKGVVLPLSYSKLFTLYYQLIRQSPTVRKVDDIAMKARIVEIRPDSIVADGVKTENRFGMYEDKAVALEHVMAGVVQATTAIVGKGEKVATARDEDLYSKVPLIPRSLMKDIPAYTTAMNKGDVMSSRYSMVLAAKTYAKASPLLVPTMLFNNFTPANEYMKGAVASVTVAMAEAVAKYGANKLKHQFTLPGPPKSRKLSTCEEFYRLLEKVNLTIGLRRGKIHALCYPVYMGELPASLQSSVTEVATVMMVRKRVLGDCDKVFHLQGYSPNIQTLLAEAVRVYDPVASPEATKRGLTSVRPDVVFVRNANLIQIPQAQTSRAVIMARLDNVIKSVSLFYQAWFVEVVLMPELFEKYTVIKHPQGHTGVVYVIGQKEPEEVTSQDTGGKKKKARHRVKGSASPSPQPAERQQETCAEMVEYCFKCLLWYVYFPFHRRVLWKYASPMTVVPVYLPIKKVAKAIYMGDFVGRDDDVDLDDVRKEEEEMFEAYCQRVATFPVQERDAETDEMHDVGVMMALSASLAGADDNQGGPYVSPPSVDSLAEAFAEGIAET